MIISIARKNSGLIRNVLGLQILVGGWSVGGSASLWITFEFMLDDESIR